MRAIVRLGVLMAGLSVALAAGAAEPATQPAVSGKPGAPVQLFNGQDLTGWVWGTRPGNDGKRAAMGEVWSVKEGVLHSTGKPTGLIRTEKAYGNFVLTVEQRHLSKGNGGIFVLIFGEDPVLPDGLQIQGKCGNVGDLINQNSSMTMTSDPARTQKANKDVVVSRIGPDPEKPLGQWNTVEITVDHGRVSVKVNGVLQNEASDVRPDAGKIGLQAEGAEMEFRKIELRPIEAEK